LDKKLLNLNIRLLFLLHLKIWVRDFTMYNLQDITIRNDNDLLSYG